MLGSKKTMVGARLDEPFVSAIDQQWQARPEFNSREQFVKSLFHDLARGGRMVLPSKQAQQRIASIAAATGAREGDVTQQALEAAFAVNDPAYLCTQRLRWLLQHLNEARFRREDEPTPDHLARLLGHEDVSTIARVLRGESAFSFIDSDALCELFGVRRRWLESGSGEPFEQEPQFRTSIEMLADLTAETYVAPRAIYIVLQDEPRGSACVFAQRTAYRYDLLLSGIPMHGDVGNTGMRHIEEFAYLLAYLSSGYRSFHTPSGVSYGCILPGPRYDDLVYGRMHPAHAFLGRHEGYYWPDDFWDMEYAKDGKGWTVNYSLAYARLRDLWHGRSNKATFAELERIIVRLNPTYRPMYIDHEPPTPKTESIA